MSSAGLPQGTGPVADRFESRRRPRRARRRPGWPITTTWHHRTRGSERTDANSFAIRGGDWIVTDLTDLGWCLPTPPRPAMVFESAQRCYELGLRAESGDGGARDPGLALKWYRKAADKGHALGRLALGRCFERGVGTNVDAAAAVAQYRRAAGQGLAEAKIALGRCLAEGTGVERDPAAAFAQYLDAARQGSAEAQALVGMCYRRGKGVQADAEQAASWYRRAEHHGSVIAANELKDMEAEAAREAEAAVQKARDLARMEELRRRAEEAENVARVVVRQLSMISLGGASTRSSIHYVAQARPPSSVTRSASPVAPAAGPNGWETSSIYDGSDDGYTDESGTHSIPRADTPSVFGPFDSLDRYRSYRTGSPDAPISDPRRTPSPAPRPASFTPTHRAAFSYPPADSTELALAEGEPIEVIRGGDGGGEGWLYGRDARGARGWFPAAYVEEINDPPPPSDERSRPRPRTVDEVLRIYDNNELRLFGAIGREQREQLQGILDAANLLDLDLDDCVRAVGEMVRAGRFDGEADVSDVLDWMQSGAAAAAASHGPPRTLSPQTVENPPPPPRSPPMLVRRDTFGSIDGLDHIARHAAWAGGTERPPPPPLLGQLLRPFEDKGLHSPRIGQIRRILHEALAYGHNAFHCAEAVEAMLGNGSFSDLTGLQQVLEWLHTGQGSVGGAGRGPAAPDRPASPAPSSASSVHLAMPEPFERFINRSDELDDYRLLRIADILARAESLDFDVAGLADAIERMLDCGRFRDDTTLQDVSMFQQFGEGAARAPEASLRPPSPPIRPSSAQSAASRTTQAEPRTCVICISEEPVAAALPCGHLILCEGCREEGAIGCGDSCPLCRRRVDGVFRIWV